MAKPHGIRVGSEKGHAGGASGVPLRLTALVSQRADGLWPFSKKLVEKDEVSSLISKASWTVWNGKGIRDMLLEINLRFVKEDVEGNSVYEFIQATELDVKEKD